MADSTIYTPYDPDFTRTLVIPEGETTKFNVYNLYQQTYIDNPQVEFISTLPSWFTNNKDANNYSYTWDISPPTSGTFIYIIELSKVVLANGNLEIYRQQYNLKIIVQDIYYNVNNCDKIDNINIVWLNRFGGRSNYIFTQRKDYGVIVGDSITYINNDIIKYAERGRNYNYTIVYQKGLSQIEVDYIDTLRYGIQAWEFDESNLEFIPIILENTSFKKYDTKNNMYEVILKITYAKQLNIQSQ